MVESAEHDLDCADQRHCFAANSVAARTYTPHARASGNGGTAAIRSEIHDTLAQSFAGVGYQLQAVRSSVAAGSPAVSEHIELAIDMVRHSPGKHVAVLLPCSPELLEGAKLTAMLEERARHLVQGTPLRIIANTDGEARQLPPRLIDALFRVGLEAIAMPFITPRRPPSKSW